MRYRILLLAVTLMVPLGASAQPLIQSQEGIALQNEILQLQQQLQQLQSQHAGSSALATAPAPASSSGASSTNPLLPGLLTQVQQLQSQVQTLSGQVSELQHQVDTQNAQTQQQIGDLKFQLTNGAGGTNTGTAPAAGATSSSQGGKPASQGQNPSPAPTQAPAPDAAPVPTTPRDALKAALGSYDQRDYRKAASVAQEIVTDHKSAPEAYRAQYLVAQSEAAIGNAQNAAVAFYNTYNMNKSGNYAARSLLGLASSLADLKQNPQACETIASLNSQFTTPSAGMKRDIQKVSARAHCG